MDHALVGLVVEVDKVGAPVGGESGRVDGVAVVLGGDVAASGKEIEGGDVVSAVAVLELDGLCAGGEGEELVAEADAKDGAVKGVHGEFEGLDGGRAVGGVAGAVGDEDSVKVVGNGVDGVVVGKDRDVGAAGDEGAENVFLDAAVNDGDVGVGTMTCRDVEGGLCGDFVDEVDGAWVEESFVLVCVVLFADGDAGEGGAAFTEKRDEGAGVYAGDCGDAFALAPVSEGLYSGPVGVAQGDVSDDDTDALDVGGFKVL